MLDECEQEILNMKSVLSKKCMKLVVELSSIALAKNPYIEEKCYLVTLMEIEWIEEKKLPGWR